MGDPQEANRFPNFQSPMGHLMRGPFFIPICMCFPLQNDSVHPKVVETLERGLERLVSAFPWLAGLVTLAADTGLPTVIPGNGKCPLTVKDHRQDSDVPDMAQLAQSRFPCGVLGREEFVPLRNEPNPADIANKGWSGPPAPVFSVQVNFIRGGLLLNFVGEHSVFDGTGIGRVLSMLSRACNDESFTVEEIQYGNCDRANIIPLLDTANFAPGPDMDYYLVGPKGLGPGYSPPTCTWGYFHFSRTSLARLKAFAATSTSISDNPAVPYTTTNDALTALIWKCTARARAPRFSPDESCLLSRTVDVRSSLAVSPAYLGNMAHPTYTRLAFGDVEKTTLGDLATTLRVALAPEKLSHAIRELMTLLTVSEDRSNISYGAALNPKKDIWFSSWARMDCYHLDFGLGLGFPVVVREPGDRAAECLMYLLPMDREGGIDAAICLSVEDMDVLRADAEWNGFAEWIG